MDRGDYSRFAAGQRRSDEDFVILDNDDTILSFVCSAKRLRIHRVKIQEIGLPKKHGSNELVP
ncbi:hypothetical protein D3C75_707720 [compost metagenome]